MARTYEVSQAARSLMNEHGLGGWTFQFDRSVQRFGCCSYSRKRISLSEKLVLANDHGRCMETVLHEIAHALAGHAAGHGPAWKAAARSMGLVNPQRCYQATDVITVAKYEGFCSSCGDKAIATRQQAPTSTLICKRHRVHIVWKDRNGRVVAAVARKPRRKAPVRRFSYWD